MPKKTTMLWLLSSAIFVYFVLTAIDIFNSHPTTNAAETMATARPPEPEEKVGEQQGSFYIPGDNRPWRVSFGDGAAHLYVAGLQKVAFTLYPPASPSNWTFPGLDHFKEADRPQNSTSDEADEEAHCRRMRQLGAKWWPSPDEQAMWSFMNPEESWPLTKPVTYFGWPAQGGV